MGCLAWFEKEKGQSIGTALAQFYPAYEVTCRSYPSRSVKTTATAAGFRTVSPALVDEVPLAELVDADKRTTAGGFTVDA